MNQDVTDFIEAIKESWQGELCSRLREVVHQSIPEVQERIQYKKPHFLKNGKYAAVISTSKDAVSFTIFNASELVLPEGMFDGPPERKTIKLRQGQTVDTDQLSSLVSQAASTL
ncbi:hypothetical protein Back11_49850 [Paenibacillus baekrokdamisoli]|uniref:YdhG-like domain-containing protein n=1 Tax=Paenibacillus baekrokdamisoli TaxID=1712516 RepID=A0A3G9IXP6_9BACL|nr:DUF1801 domain-containing protein [Paenibacillus baekrokdamisoli]MBB3068813.1 hypothetical protein [Paenibacillus baekrokdamisoli]BBH23640.1 hypothetical protein Back11_49850 [Paenibacillus baekrokdamisoli]